MQHLLNLLAAIALLVWGTHIVRKGVLRMFGDTLRQVIARIVENTAQAVIGDGVSRGLEALFGNPQPPASQQPLILPPR